MNPNDVATRSFDDRPAGLSVEQALLLETACDAFEAAWRGGGRPDIGAAVLALPEPIRPTALRELIHLDVYYRRKAGEASAAADYAGRFPDLEADWLAAAVAGAATDSTLPPLDAADPLEPSLNRRPTP